MKLFPLLLVAYVSGLFVLRHSEPAGDWSRGEIFWLHAGAILLTTMVLGNWLVRMIRSVPEHLRVAALAGTLIAAYAGFTFSDAISDRVTRLIAGEKAVAAVADAGVSASVDREWDGHFRTTADINGLPVEMLVDTGASLVLLTYEDGVAAGLDMDSLDFDVPILTANGKGHVATVTFDKIDIGGVAARNVRGAVAQPGQLHASLLGMSFIGAIEEAVIRKDQLILKN